MDADKLRRGIIPGIIAGYIFLAFVGAGMTNPSATSTAESTATSVMTETEGEDGAVVTDIATEVSTEVTTEVSASMGNGMLDMVGGMIGADAFIGFILHVIISAVIGALYVGVFTEYAKLGNPLMDIAVGGLIYGIIWWVIGANLIMPIIAGGDVLQLNFQAPSFFGHIIFGHVLAFTVIIRDAALGIGDDD